MSITLKRRLHRLEQAAGKSKRARAVTLIEPVADACEAQWKQFAIRKTKAEASAETIVVIRAGRPARPINYQCRVVIVPPKIPAMVEIRPLPMKGNAHGY